MSRPEATSAIDSEETTVESYVMDVRIVECVGPEDEPRYRFEAPAHVDTRFDDLETARLYADVFFDVNGFREEGTGEHGVPPAIFQGGKDTLAAYLLTRPGIDINWVASFFGVDRVKAERYVSWVGDRAETIRERARKRGME